MSALRISTPERCILVDLGPGTARGLAHDGGRPVPAGTIARPGPTLPAETLHRRERQAAAARAYRARRKP